MIETYMRLFAGLRSEDQHVKFHLALWPSGPDSGDEGSVSLAILRELPLLLASEADKIAVLQHCSSDWRQCRVIATIASSASSASD